MPLPKKNVDDQPLKPLQSLYESVRQTSVPLPEPLLKQIRTCILSKSSNAETVRFTNDDNSSTLLNSILETAATPSLPYQHRALAADTLSAWLIRSKMYPALQRPLGAAHGTDVWLRICQLVLDNFDDASTALAKALKDLLANALSTVGTGTKRGKEVMQWMAASALQGINVGEGRKGGYYSLDVALRKGVGAEWVFGEYRRIAASSASQEGGGRLVEDLLRNLEDRNLCPSIGKACVSLLAARRKEIMVSRAPELEWVGVWDGPLRRSLQNEELRTRVQIYILPGLFKESAVCFGKFVNDIGYAQFTGAPGAAAQQKMSEEELGSLLCCLSVGKDLGFVGDVGDEDTLASKKIAKHQRVHLKADFVEPLFAHAQPHIRLAALNLVSHSAMISKPLSSSALEILKSGLPHLHTESDPEVRDQVIAGIRSLIERLAASTYAVEKELKNLHGQLERSEERRTSRADLEQSRYLDSRLEDAKQFCLWYISYLRTLLRPGTSYQRNITALRALTTMIKSGVDASLADYAFAVSAGRGSVTATGKVVKKGHLQWPEFASDIKIFLPETVDALSRAMFNPFHDVRALAAETMRFKPKWVTGRVISVLEDGIDVMNQTGREKHSDGVARILGLMFENIMRGQFKMNEVVWGIKMEADDEMGVARWILDVIDRQYLITAEADFQIAIKTRPVYGLFQALGLILQVKGVYDNLSPERAAAWKEFHLRVFDACKRVWKITKGPLCDQSPEGYVPDDAGDDEHDEDMESQTIMSYSWRAVKETSGLLGLILQKAPFSEAEPETATIHKADLRTYGEMLLEQLSEIRHRGAFSAVSPAFVALCTRCFRHPDPTVEDLPREWLRTNLQQILQKSNVITRRSAGLPMLIVGILASEKDRARPLMHSTFRRFVEIATIPAPNKAEGEKMDLPQVHALNCIKFLFTDARVSDPVAPFIGEALELAVGCFGSEIWAIRNCGVMLFTALTNRLFGTKKSRNEYLFTASAFTTKTFFERYPSVRTVLLQNLTEKVGDLEHGGSTAVEMVYPALSLIARLDAAPEYDGMEDFRKPIEECMRSRIWKVREMSARAYATLVTPKECLNVIDRLLQIPVARRNSLHGNLCAVRALMERRLMQTIVEDRGDGRDIWARCFAVFAQHFDALVVNNKCSVNVGVLLQLINTHLLRLYESPDLCPELLTAISHYIPTAASVFSHIESSSMIGQTFLKEYLTAFSLTHFLSTPGATPELEALLLSPDWETAFFTRTALAGCTRIPILSDATIQTLFAQAVSGETYHLLRTGTFKLLRRLLPSSPSDEHFSQLIRILENPPANEDLLAAALPLAGTFVPASGLLRFTNALRAFAAGSSDYPLRAAALEGVASAAAVIDITTENVIPLLVVLYVLLTDDDPDIRNDATTLVCSSRVLDLPQTLLPDAAAKKLLSFLSKRFGASPVLFRELVPLVKGEKMVRDVLEDKNKGVLFEVEKDNLWRDEVEVAQDVAGLLGGMVAAEFQGAGVEELKIWKKENDAVLADVEDEGSDEGLWIVRERVRLVGEILGSEAA